MKPLLINIKSIPFLLLFFYYLATYLYNINLLKPTGHVMYQHLNIQQLYVLPKLYLFVLYVSDNKQRLVPLTPQTDLFL